MNPKKFYATRSREAINMVRAEFGPDAEIISNKIVNGWVEVTARKGQSEAQAYSSFPENGPSNAVTQSASRLAPADVEPPAPLAPPLYTAPPEPLTPTLPTTPHAQQSDPAIREVMNEIRGLRKTVEIKLDDLTWSNRQNIKPGHHELLNAVIMAGFSPALSKRLVEKLPNDYTSIQALEWARNILGKNLHIAENESQIIDAGGVIALIGPTGVGKTTTLAKIAARFVLKHGADNLALITTDSYRVGAIEQLRVYGKILGVPVHAANDMTDLQYALTEFKNKHTVLIDTPGLNQRDPRVTAQLAMLTDVGFSVKKILCLNATNHIETANDVVHAYQTQSLEGCIITKTDEAMTLGNTLNVVMQHKLKVHYITTGQRVPEDIELVNKNTLLQRVLPETGRQAELTQMNEDVFPIVFSGGTRPIKKESDNHA